MSKNTWLGQESDPSFFVYTRYSVSVVHRHIASSWRIWQALWHPFWRKKKTEKEDQNVVNVLISVHSMLDLILLSSKRYFKQEMKPFVVMEVRYWCSQTEVFWISWQQWSDATMQASNLWYYFSFMCWAVCDAIPLCLIVDAGFIQHGRMETLISHFKPSSSVTVGWRFVVNMSSHMMWHFSHYAWRGNRNTFCAGDISKSNCQDVIGTGPDTVITWITPICGLTVIYTAFCMESCHGHPLNSFLWFSVLWNTRTRPPIENNCETTLSCSLVSYRIPEQDHPLRTDNCLL